MDALSLRVAARFAARPIPLDKAAIKQLSNRLAEELAAFAGRHHLDQLLGHNDNLLEWSWVAKTVTKGENVTVAGRFFSAPSSSKSLITGAHVTKADLLDDADVVLAIRLNGSLPYSAFTDTENEGTAGLRWLINNELVHELTHVAEWWFLPKRRLPTQESDVLKSEEGAQAYYNSPHEVRAFMQQVVDEILPKAAGFRRVTKPASTHDFVTKLLNTSRKWKQIEPHLNQQSTATLIKGVYRSLVDAGVIS